MSKLTILSAAEQVAAHLRGRLAAGVWRGEMPGVVALASDLGVNHKTVDVALGLLERDGLLANAGARKPRRILFAADDPAKPSLRIGILPYDAADRRVDYMLEILHLLLERGHEAFFAKRALTSLAMRVDRVAACVQSTPASAWVVMAASREVMEWFAEQPVPVFGLFGFIRKVPIACAGPDKTRAYVEAVRALSGLGHRRIVLLARPQRRSPMPGFTERHFLRALGEAGIEVTDYHFPLWENTREGLQQCLEMLFHVNPPTALVVQEIELFGVVQQFLLARGIRVPEDVSLVCDDPDPAFNWRVPSVAHISWSIEPSVRRVVQWADHIACGKDDRRKLLTRAEFVDGGTLGPVKR